MKRFVLLMLFCLVSGNVWARDFTPAQKHEDFQSLVSQVRSGYGPLDYKRDVQGIDLEVVAQEFEAKIQASTSNAEFYYLMAEFISRFKDGHFNPTIPTDHKAELPFSAELVAGKVLIDWIDRNRLPESEFPFQRGDEIIEFDGRPVDQVVTDLTRYMQSGRDISIRRKATWTLTLRRGSRMPVATGALGRMTVRKAQTGRVVAVRDGLLQWQMSGSPLFETIKERRLGPSDRTNFGQLSIRESLTEMLDSRRIERTYACNPGTRIAIPEGATVLMHPDQGGPFAAYYHPDMRFGGNVGYVRIPDYSPMKANGDPDYEARFQQYEWVISELEKNTVGLVIDQDHNCGGSVEYLERMLGLFMPQDYSATMFQLLATPESYLDIKSWMEEAPPFSRARASVEEVLRLVRTTYEAGGRLTPMTSITGVRTFAPNRIHYTKPIVMLVDEIAGSGGDAFPSMLSGFKRVRLIGTATSGLGGHVGTLQPLPYSRFGGRLTKSLFYRPDGVPVENNGAEPLVQDRYSISYNDFVDGYREYQAFYLNKLLDMVQTNQIVLP